MQIIMCVKKVYFCMSGRREVVQNVNMRFKVTRPRIYIIVLILFDNKYYYMIVSLKC